MYVKSRVIFFSRRRGECLLIDFLFLFLKKRKKESKGKEKKILGLHVREFVCDVVFDKLECK